MSIAETSAEIIRCCAAACVPCGVPPAEAIAAHRTAPNQYTLRAIILARDPEPKDTRAMLDYLAGLPDAVWQQMPVDEWAEWREETLAVFRRRIAWSTICV